MYRNLECFVSFCDNKISFYRNKYGYSQQYIADILGVSVNTVSSWETLQFSPSLYHAMDLASLFRVPVEELFWRVCYFRGGNQCLECSFFSDIGCVLDPYCDPYSGPFSIHEDFYNG